MRTRNRFWNSNSAKKKYHGCLGGQTFFNLRTGNKLFFKDGVMAKLQSDRYERGYFHKIWMEYYCLCKNHASETIISNFFGVKIHTSCKKFYILGGQKPTFASFLEFRFFLPEKSKLYRYYQNKNQLGFASSSYINITMKLLIKSKNSPKAG